jgi:DNA-binding LacI/PurR family transcriptional regulator
MAFGVLAAMYQAGLKVGFGPDCDYRVAGHDNQRFSAYTCPPLTTVSQDCDEIGRVALSMLLARIDSGEPAVRGSSERVLLDGALVLRKSA